MSFSDNFGWESNTFKAKRKREEDLDRAEKTNNSINKYFSKGHAAAAPKPKARIFSSNPAIVS